MSEIAKEIAKILDKDCRLDILLKKEGLQAKDKYNVEGTFNNIINLLEFDKQVVLYYLPNQKFYYFKKKDELKEFLVTNVKLDSKLKKLLNEKEIKSFFLTCLF